MGTTAPTNPVCAANTRVVRCEPACRDHVAIDLALSQFPASQPGQFLQLLCHTPDFADSAERAWPRNGFPSLSQTDFGAQQAFLRRPFSIADQWTAPNGTVRLSVIARVVGPGTRWLAQLRPDDTLNVTGPLGCGFRLPPADRPVVLIGGGCGIPPLLYLARRLRELGWQDVTAMIGARTRDLLPVRLTAEPATDATPTFCVAYPGEAQFATLITSDDGSVGTRGLVSDSLGAWYARRGTSRQPATAFACGPEAMLKAVAGSTRQLGIACQLCIERNMGCGMGACLSCVVRVRDAGQPRGWRWALVCHEGPVFERDELLDYGPVASA